MAPRHGTSGAGSPDPSDNKSPASKAYGTRASKRKVSEVDTTESHADAVSPMKRATRTTRKSKLAAREASEGIEPPIKKLRSSATDAVLISKTEPTPTPTLSSETPQSVADEVSDQQSVETPASEDAIIKVSSPKPEISEEPITDGEDIQSTTPAIFDDVLASRELNGGTCTKSPAKRGRGGYRGRGRGGRISKAAAKIKSAAGAREAKLKSLAKASPTPLIEIPPTPRRGGRRRATFNPRIDAFSLRASELKVQYSALAKLQKKALRALADKSLEKVQNEPLYHEQVPEFDKVSQELREIFDNRIEKINLHEKLEIGVAMNAQRYGEKAAEDQFNRQVEEADGKAFARMKEHAMYVWHQYMRSADLEDIPIPHQSEGDSAKMYDITEVPVRKEVHPFSTPFGRPEYAYPSTFTEGDTEYHQHPRNVWKTLDATSKEALRKERDFMSSYVGKNQRAMQMRRDTGKKIRNRSKTFKNIPKTYRVMQAEQEAATALDMTPSSKAAGKRGAKQAPKISIHSSEPIDWDSSADEAEAADEYGVEIIPGGRIRQPPTMKFEDHEIGIRQTHWVGEKIIGTDASPNPAAFCIDQQPGGCMYGDKLTSLKESDFDQEIIKAHKLHPRLGIRLPESVNPDRDELEDPYFPPPTDWSKPLPIPKSQRVVETYADGSRKYFHAGVNWVQEVEAQWVEFGPKVAMWQLLESTGDLKTLFPRATKNDNQEMKVLAEACKQIEAEDKKKEAEARIQAKADYERRLTREAEAARASMRITYPSSSAYDPVRDTTYQTPYPRTAQYPPPPFPSPAPVRHAPYRKGTSLATLADIAEAPPPPPSRKPSMLPPSRWVEPPTQAPELPPPDLMERTLRLQRMSSLPPPGPGYEYRPPMGPPLPMTAPQQMGLAPNNNFLPAPPLPPQSSRGNNQPLRPLQPAPPRGGRRATPPQASSSNRGGTWYGKQ